MSASVLLELIAAWWTSERDLARQRVFREDTPAFAAVYFMSGVWIVPETNEALNHCEKAV